jgi:hypothetical protein
MYLLTSLIAAWVISPLVGLDSEAAYMPAGDEVTSVAISNLGKPIDLAVDREKKSLYGLYYSNGQVRIMHWSSTGSTISEWDLGGRFQPVSILYFHRGHLSAVFRDGSMGAFVEITFRNGQPSPTVTTLPGDTRSFDAELNTVRANAARKLMRHLSLIPLTSPGQHVADHKQLIDHFRVNARDVRAEHLWLSPGLRVIAFGHPLGDVNVLMSNGGKTYRSWGLRDTLEAAVTKKQPNTTLVLRTLYANERVAICGLEVHDGTSVRNVVARVLRDGTGWKVVQQEAGRMARPIETF